MKPILVLLLGSLFGPVSPMFSVGLGPDAWVSLEVPVAQEPSVVQTLESKGFVALGWSNALVDVSAFDGVENRLLSTLDQTMTPWDPRWDPWLRSLKPWFHRSATVSLVWVEAPRRDAAVQSLGSSVSGLSHPSSASRRVTGWLLISLGVFFGGLRLASEGVRWSRPWRRWIWLPLTILVILCGGLMVGDGWVDRPHPAPSSVSWLQHRWFQESWPYGAHWADWKPGIPWKYPTFDHKDGKLVETLTPLTVPDRAWVSRLYSGLDPHHVARLFTPENP